MTRTRTTTTTPNENASAPSTSATISSSSSTTTTSSTTTPQWHNLVAGGIAGAGSRIVTAPLDLIRIRRQLQATTVVYPSESMWTSWQKIVATEKGGIAALFRGNTAAIYLWISYAAVQFAVYTPLRQAASDLPGAAFGAGAVAGVCATLATYPFDVCRTTFAARGVVQATTMTSQRESVFSTPPPPPPPPLMSHSSMIEPAYPLAKQVSTPPQPATPTTTSPAVPRTLGQFVVQLYQTRGVAGFYAGAGPAVAQIIPYMGLNFGLYDMLQSRAQWSSPTAGAVAGAISKLVIYPVDTVKRRLQVQAFFDDRMTTSTTSSSQSATTSHHRVYQTVTEIYQQGGWRSFYRGVLPSLLKTTIATSLSFSLFKCVKDGLAANHAV